MNKLINKAYMINSYSYELLKLYDGSTNTEDFEVYLRKDVDKAIIQDKQDFIFLKNSILNEINNINNNCKDKNILRSLQFILLFLRNHESKKEYIFGSNHKTQDDIQCEKRPE